MQSTVAILALLASVGAALPGQPIAERAACSTNACLAALASQTATAKSDCSIYQRTTVTPCSKTVKSTITLTSTIGCSFTGAPVVTGAVVSSSAACPATQSPTAIPSYASACADGAAYSSACGCLNVGAKHTTLAASTVTATTYKTVKATPTFIAKMVQGSFYNGQYIRGGDGNPHFGGDTSSAERLTINANGTVFSSNGTAPWGSDSSNCYGCFNPVYEYSLGDTNAPLMKCSLGSTLQGDGYLSFSCKTPGGASRFQTCFPDGDNLDIGGSPNNEWRDCYTLTLGAYPVCSS